MADQLIQVASGSHPEHLLGAMWKLRTTGDLCDVTIQVDFRGELEEFEAHRIVLAAASGYFSSLLLAGKDTKKVFLNNVSPNMFSKFLQYAYSGKMEVERSFLGNVSHMAKQLDCRDLTEACGTQFDDHDYGSAGPGDAEAMMNAGRERSRRAGRNAAETRKPIRVTLRTDWERNDSVQARRSSRLGGRRDGRPGEAEDGRGGEDFNRDAPEEPPRDLGVGETVTGPAERISPREDAFTVGGSGFSFVPVAADDDDDDVQDLDFLPVEEAGKTDEAQKGGRASGVVRYKCERCTCTFCYEKSYLKHMRVSHGIQSDTAHRCDVCRQTFANRSNLRIHQRHVHSDARLFACGVCGKTFKRKKDVTRHTRQVHEGGVSRHACAVCGKSLSSRTALKLHSRTHTGDKPYSCSECGTRFSQSSALKTHERIHTGEKPFVCDMCDARFTQNHMLAYHKRAHTGERPYMCENCGKSFASKEYLKHHARIHSGLKPFKCENCGRAFAQRNSLHQHMKTHTGERPYPCSDCEKQFTQLNALQRHQRIHTGEKPYMCSLCGRTFTDKSTVRRHALTHDKKTPWKNYLIVLPNNVEGRVKKSRTSVKKSTSSERPPQTEKTPEPVTVSGEWPGTGTITVVSHATLGNLTVIQTEMVPGTQLQPLVSADISLEGSAVGIPVAVPYPIPISATLTGTVALCEPDAVLAPAVPALSDSFLSAPAGAPETQHLQEQLASDSQQAAADREDPQTVQREAVEI